MKTYGVWSSGEYNVRTNFDRNFRNLFTTNGPREMGNVVECVNLVISNAMNMNLLKPIVPQEIKDAVFEMGSLKALGLDGFRGIFFYQHLWQQIFWEAGHCC